MAFLDDKGLSQVWNKIQNKATDIDDTLAQKVDKEVGKGLSTNDYTTDEKTKLAGIEKGATNTDYAASNEYYTATFDGVDTLYSSFSCNLYSVTVNNGKIPSDLTGLEPVGVSLIVAFEESSEASSSSYSALRINNSNYYLIGGRSPTSGGGSLLKPTNQLFLNNPRRIEFSLKSSHDTSSLWRGLWIIPDSGIGLVKQDGDTMTGNLSIQGSLYPSLYLLPTYNSTTNRTVFEGSYFGASSFSAWEDSTGKNRRMLEIRTKTYENSLDNAVLLRTSENGKWGLYRLFHTGMETPIPIINGGTGATTAEGARTNLDVPSRSGAGAGGTWQINIGGTATSISSATPILSTGAENNAITVKTNENGSLGINNLAIRSALDFRWYNTNWQVGNLRGSSTDSIGFGFSYSNDGGSTYALKSYIDINGNYIGNASTATKLKNYYSSRPTTADLAPDGSGGIINFKATSSMTTNKPGEGHILHMFWDNTGGWDSQLFIPEENTAPKYRYQTSGTWGSWINFLTENNYINYTVTKTGGGASGTWSIDISGTSARSNILTNNVFTTDNINNVVDNGLHFGTVSNYDGPGFQSNDGLILSMSWNSNNSYGAQLAFDDLTTANMYVRNKNNSWSNWEKVLLSNNYTDYTVKKDGTGASGTWEISITGGAAAAIQDGSGNVISSTYCKLSGGNPMTPPANGDFAASSSSGAWFYDSGFGLCSIGRGNGDGASLGASGKANLFIKSWYGVGFVSTQANTGVAVAINCRTGEVLANNFTGSGASLTSLNASNITSGTLAIAYGGTGSTSKSGARTNLGIISGTSLPSASGYSTGDIFVLY